MNEILRKCLAEAIGTFAIVFFGCGSIIVLSNTPGSHMAVNVVFGLTVAVMIYSLGHVSSAHFNPAVTIGLASGGLFPWRQVGPYILAQVLGGFAASGLHAAFLPVQSAEQSFGATGSVFSPLSTVAFEGLLTFFLVLVICGSATDERAPKGFAGLAIGFTVMLCGLFAGPLTGNSLNPARSLAPAAFSGQLGSVTPYLLGPILGGTIAVQVYRLLRGGQTGPNAASLETNPGTSLLNTETVSK